MAVICLRLEARLRPSESRDSGSSCVFKMQSISLCYLFLDSQYQRFWIR